MKRKWLHELPYLLIALYATKIGQAWRLAEGTDAAHKLLSLMDSLSASFASPLPSFELHDLCIGLLLGAGFRLFIFIKDSEKKKYRKGREYGSARWADVHWHIIWMPQPSRRAEKRLFWRRRARKPRKKPFISPIRQTLDAASDGPWTAFHSVWTAHTFWMRQLKRILRRKIPMPQG